jgi:hypothetical protein
VLKTSTFSLFLTIQTAPTAAVHVSNSAAGGTPYGISTVLLNKIRTRSYSFLLYRRHLRPRRMCLTQRIQLCLWVGTSSGDSTALLNKYTHGLCFLFSSSRRHLRRRCMCLMQMRTAWHLTPLRGRHTFWQRRVATGTF